MNLLKYYPIQDEIGIKKFLESYLPLLSFAAGTFSLNLSDRRFSGDHLGLQVTSGEEFDMADKLITGYAKMIHDSIIHERRNRVYQFNSPISAGKFSFRSIEVFEPKPEADLRRLKPGFEHLAFRVDKFEEFYETVKLWRLPVDKFKEMNGSKFFKTSLINLVEIEFRNDYLGSFD